jgi:hypothetical protein
MHLHQRSKFYIKEIRHFFQLQMIALHHAAKKLLESVVEKLQAQ